jgi:hypothetical protein
VWYATQSFHLLKAGAQCADSLGDPACQQNEILPEENSHNSTSTSDSPGYSNMTYIDNDDEQQHSIMEYLMHNPEYGRTAGTSPCVMKTIAGIRALAAKLESHCGSRSIHVTQAPPDVTRSLLEYQRKSLEVFNHEKYMNSMAASVDSDAYLQPLPADLHLQAFQAGVVIYYYQTCDRVSPRTLSSYVTVVLRSLWRFYDLTGGGCFTLWPLIIAAMEAVDTQQQMEVMTLLDMAATAGMRNLGNHRQFITRVWRARQCACVAEGLESLHETRVDWRKIMREAGMDLLVF